MHQHDDGGVGAREMHGAAIPVKAFAQMARVPGFGRAAADTAEHMARMPVHDALGVGQDRCFRPVEHCADRPQVDEFAVFVQVADFMRFKPGNIDREMGDIVAHAQHHGKRRHFDQRPRRARRQHHAARFGTVRDQAARSPDRDHHGVIGRVLGVQPHFVGAQMRRPVEHGVGIMIVRFHEAISRTQAQNAQLAT